MDRKTFFQALAGLAFTPTKSGLWAPPVDLASGVVAEEVIPDNGFLGMKAQVWRGNRLVLDTGIINARVPCYSWLTFHDAPAEILSSDGSFALRGFQLLMDTYDRKKS